MRKSLRPDAARYFNDKLRSWNQRDLAGNVGLSKVHEFYLRHFIEEEWQYACILEFNNILQEGNKSNYRAFDVGPYKELFEQSPLTNTKAVKVILRWYRNERRCEDRRHSDQESIQSRQDGSKAREATT